MKEMLFSITYNELHYNKNSKTLVFMHFNMHQKFNRNMMRSNG